MHVKQAIQMVVSMALAGCAHLALAQTALEPLSPKDRVMAETSRTPSMTWLGNVRAWEQYEPRSYSVVPREGAVQTLMGSVPGQAAAKLRFDATSFMTIPYIQELAPEVLLTTTTRPGDALAPGMKWTSQITYVGAPADWCPNERKSTFEGSFEVEPQELYPLRIDGKDIALPVLPVVERGVWKRCYTGKRYQRFLWSPDLQTVVAIEFQTYNPLGKLHEASFAMRLKEIERGKDGEQP